MLSACKKEECTFATTQACLLNNDPSQCPERLFAGITETVDPAEQVAAIPSPSQNAVFASSFTLSATDALSLMSARYCRLVGILGIPDAGKTAALVCTYLLASGGKLTGFEFRDSRTLRALEEICRGARRWKIGDPPGDLTTHTEAPDERAAGFLHLRLAHAASKEAVDFLFPDLPGEWSTSLIEHNRSDRLAFLKAAEVIWLMVDGIHLTDRSLRLTATHRLKLLLQRVAVLCGDSIPAVHLVISRHDQVTVQNASYSTLVEEAKRLGIALSVFQIASFSEDDSVAPGAGISELLEAVLVYSEVGSALWPDEEPRADTRQMLRFRQRP